MQILSKLIGLCGTNGSNKNINSITTSGKALINAHFVCANLLMNTWQHSCHVCAKEYSTVRTISNKMFTIVSLWYPLYIEFCTTGSEVHSEVSDTPSMNPITSSTAGSCSWIAVHNVQFAPH
jgi:hypothetical protein